jgi:putative ABC transport system permease protein
MRLLTFCFRNLFRRKARTSLCITGVALATTFLIAVGAATLRYTTVLKEMSVLFADQIMVTSKEAIVIQAIPISRSMLPQNYTVEKLQEVEGVEKAIPVLFITPIGIGEVIQPVPVNFTMGIPVNDWQLVLGSTPLRGNVGHFPTDESSNEIIVGPSLADQHNLTAGALTRINDHVLKIVGILDTKLALLNRCILMPLRLAQTIYSYEGSVNIITVKPSQGILQANLASDIKAKINYVQALTEDDRNDMIQPIIGQIEIWNVGLETVVLAMSLILVTTVTLMTVSERRRDFATLDAIGAPLSYVFRIVILETSLIGILGGAVGVFFGSLGALGLASFYTSIPLIQFFPSLFEIVPPLYMFEMILAIIACACLGGTIPALNAMRMHVADILRAEY